ncbi:NAD(P)/FAD-dependent oxidoreductase [Mesonia sp. K7]|uniref:phytoene desaturase family protein n=1 Tax=Mesonia sp. K7 TaxID=2218606 RepID=UPI001F1AEB94|nr:NAD(P)/FAD-dependent oxidoreductase [Mesonia sp. K7]
MYDVIIIGSGAGGLASAICLAEKGKKVLVLEQHEVPGGWCHSFYIDGQRHSPGLHYVGLLDEGQSSNQLYKDLGIANDLTFFRMHPEAYERCHIGSFKFGIPNSYQVFRHKLIKLFPNEEKGIIKLFDLIKKVNHQVLLIPKLKTFWDFVTVPFRTKEMGKYGLSSLERVVKKFIKDPILQQIFYVQCGDHASPPNKIPFPFHCVLMGHYEYGGFYPMGGGAALVKAKTKRLKQLGGEIKTSTKVEKILVENKNAAGVKLVNGDKIFAKTIISNADPNTTFLKLVGKNHISKRLCKKLSKTSYSLTSLILFLTVDCDLKKYGMHSGNIWRFAKADITKALTNDLEKPLTELEEFPGIFISCTTLKDPTSFDGKHHNFEVVTLVSYEHFKAFEGLDKDRGEAYFAFKEKLISIFMVSLEKEFPGIKNHIVHQELGTPLTNKYYINTTEGNIYGTEKILKQIGPFSFRPKTEIKNLYLTGASIVAHGVVGAAHSGVNTAAKVLGVRPEELLEEKENQKLTILEAEDNTHWPEEIKKKIALKQERLAKKQSSTHS